MTRKHGTTESSEYAEREAKLRVLAIVCLGNKDNVKTI